MSALWTSDEVARALVPSTISAPFEASGVTFDSRAVGKGDLFFALSGETTDGHGFVADALARGAAAAVVSRDVESAGGTLIRVPDTMKALVDLGHAARRRSPARIASVTGAPGRLQLVARHRTGADVYVDYAHKPEALQTVLATLRPFAHGRLIVVFGCGGDRDRAKRPVMGEIATRLADLTLVTDDNPRSEEPEAIRAEIVRGIPPDRRNWIEVRDGGAAQRGRPAVDRGQGP